MHLRRLALALGLLWFLGLWAACTVALYRAPWTPDLPSWDGHSWRLAPGQERVLSVNGQPVNRFTFMIDNVTLQSRAELRAWLDAREALFDAVQGPSVQVQVEGPQGIRTLELPVTQSRWRFLRQPALLHLPVAVLFFLVGWATYLRPHSGPQAFWFYLTCLSMSLVYLTNVAAMLAPLAFWPPLYRWVTGLNVCHFVLAPTLLLHLALLLPHPRVSRAALAALYSLGGVIAFGHWIEAHPLWVPPMFLGSLLAIAQGAWAYRREPIARQQMKWVAAGFLFGIGPWFLVNGLPMLLWGQRLLSDTVPGAFLICIPLFMAVAIHRYRLFDLESLLEGTAVYLLTLAVLLVCEVAVLAALGQGAQVRGTDLLLLAVLASTYGSLRSRLGDLVASLFRRREVDLREALGRLHRYSAGRSAAQTLAALQETVAHYFAPTGFETVEVSADRPPGAYLESDPSGSVLLIVSAGHALRCGPLPGGRRYLAHSLSVLAALTEQARLYYEHAHYYQESLRQRQQRLEERENLLGDLHDGVGSALASIRLISQEAAVADLAADALFELQSFLYEDDAYQMELRSWLAEVRAYTNRVVQRQSSVRFDIDAAGQLERPLSRALALSLLRLIREALNNSLRHAGAQSIRLQLRAGERLELCFQDDGRGLPAEALQGRGLSGIRRRVEKLGGCFQIENRPGCTLLISLPWETAP